MYTLDSKKLQEVMPIVKWAETLGISNNTMFMHIKKCSFDTIQRFNLTIYVNEQDKLSEELDIRLARNKEMKEQLEENNGK